MLIRDQLDHSATIHAKHTKLERPVPFEGNSYEVNAGNSSYIQCGPRRNCHGYGRFGPRRRAWYVAKSWVKSIYLTVGRVDQGPHSRDNSTGHFPHHESRYYWGPSMSVITFRCFDSSVAFARADFLFISRPGPRLSDFKFNLRTKCRKMWLHHQPVSEAFQAVCSPFYP